MTEQRAHQVVQKAIGDQPWLVSRQELEEAIQALEDCIDTNNVWELRYCAESHAVLSGQWPAEVPVPPNVDLS